MMVYSLKLYKALSYCTLFRRNRRGDRVRWLKIKPECSPLVNCAHEPLASFRLANLRIISDGRRLLSDGRQGTDSATNLIFFENETTEKHLIIQRFEIIIVSVLFGFWYARWELEKKRNSPYSPCWSQLRSSRWSPSTNTLPGPDRTSGSVIA